MSLRIGIDVGGTNTDAVLMDGVRVVSKSKTPTSEDVTRGITIALRHVLETSGTAPHRIAGVMIGTTHFTNAIVERRRLQPTAAVRLGLPATTALPPMVDWPEDFRAALGAHTYLCHGGNEFDGRRIAPLDSGEIERVAADIRAKGITAIAVTSVFSPATPSMEIEAADLLQANIPGSTVTRSSEIGRIGLLERENAAILNACLRPLAEETIGAFKRAIAEFDITAPLYLTQNDGTLMSAELAQEFPVLTFASGPTNSMRGAAFLSGMQNAVVVDIGGTTTDVGVLTNGFPRQASLAVDIGGVRTNFRMPDVFSIGLGGGSVIEQDPLTIGPRSVGYRLTNLARIFGGDSLTASDIAVAAGIANIGDQSRVSCLDPVLVARAIARIRDMCEAAVERMKTSAEPIPIILVGGGSVLISEPLAGASKMVKPEHFEAANAVGAAIAQISGEVDRVYALDAMTREAALSDAIADAANKAITAGADPATVQIVDVDEVPLAYLPGNATRVRAKAVGDLPLSA